jgi:DNA-binding SARP family transcriptional activator
LSLSETLDLASTLVAGTPGAGTAPHAGAPLLVVDAREISVDGAVVPPDAWRSPEPRELLFYLLDHPAGRTREQIGRALWPGASPAQIKNSLHVALHQLRRVLGRPDWIVFEEGRYRLNPGFRVEHTA